MKRTIVLLVFLMPAIVLLGQDKNKTRKEVRAEKNARIEAIVDSLVQSRNYKIIAQNAQPMGWQQINLTGLYNVMIKGDSVVVDLPYYGRAYQVDYASTEGGIKIDSAIEKYKERKRRGNNEISFETSTKSDHYQFKLTITSSGYATIFVNSNNRQAINFSGVLDQVH